MSHRCQSCGLEHGDPKASNALRIIAQAVAFGVVEVLAALQLGGVLAALLWVIAAWNAFLLVTIIVGLANAAVSNATEVER